MRGPRLRCAVRAVVEPWEAVACWSLLYLGFRRVLEPIVVRFRRGESTEIEIFVLRVIDDRYAGADDGLWNPGTIGR